MFTKLFKNRKKKSFKLGAERLAPMREEFPNENFLNEGRIVVDIRDKESIEELGYFEGSVFIPFDENFVKRVKELNSPVYVLCERGVDSYNATKLLKKHGIDAENLNGGFYYIREVLNVKPIF